MPEPMPNDIVLSLAGHDRGKLFLVVGAESDGRLLLCDGKNRRLADPKPKSPKHVRLVLRGANAPGTDKAIRTTLALAAQNAAAKEERHLGER